MRTINKKVIAKSKAFYQLSVKMPIDYVIVKFSFLIKLYNERVVCDSDKNAADYKYLEQTLSN
jgi:hypothetical protein